MNTYVGTKIVNALPMTRGEYNEYRGWALPADEDGADEGYLVEYLDGGKPNHPEHVGYISWSPKAQFDAANVPVGNIAGLPPHLIRVRAEQAQLAERVTKLAAFVLDNPTFQKLHHEERELLQFQLRAMEEYLMILERRCKLHARNTA